MADSSEKRAYSQILKATSIVGGAEVASLVLGMVRVKFSAGFIGPLGVGLVANFQAIQGTIGTFANMGINQSGVREVADKVASGDEAAISRVALTVSRVALLMGLVGAVVMALLSPLLSEWIFGSGEYGVHIAAVSSIVLLSNLSGAQQAIIQGMRRIGDLARIKVIGALLGTLISIVLYAEFGVNGIVPCLIALAATQLAISWHYVRQIQTPNVQMSWKESFTEASHLVRLGFFLMSATLVNTLAHLVTRALITHQEGLVALGLFSAAYALSGMVVNFVTTAMAADYYPRLTAAVSDHNTFNRLVNQQTEVGILLAVPGLLAMLTLAPWVIRIFYTQDFLPAANLLQWFMLGCLGRVIAWPLEYIMLALSKGSLYFWIMLLFNVLHLLLNVAGLFFFGIEGVAMAFPVLYILSTGIVYVISHKLTGFSWSPDVVRLTLLVVTLAVIGVVIGRELSLWPATFIGLMLAAAVSIFSLKRLTQLIGADHRMVKKICRVPVIRWLCGI